MAIDPAVSLRIINNERVRIAGTWGEYRDLGGALALTSDAPAEALNCIEGFTTAEATLDSLLDLGFSLLRAFDRLPAVRLTELDRPASLPKVLERRGLRPADHTTAMVFRGDAASLRRDPAVTVQRAGHDDARVFANIAAPSGWAKALMLPAVLVQMLDPGHYFYIAYVDGEAAGTAHLLIDEAAAGIYAVATKRDFRRRGVCSTLIATAIQEAQAQQCDVIGLRTATNSDAHRLFASLGFEDAHTSVVWAGA